jgi:3',5'-nucleoside bisphosphate phosphatase
VGARAEDLALIQADLHVHTVLSPCAEVEMIPPLIVQRALQLGLGLIAVTDHNSADNCAAVIRAAQGTNLTVLPGMEVQTREEVHVLCLFDEVEQALAWQGIVYDHLPGQQNPEELLGAQYVVDSEGSYLKTESRLLLTSTDLTLDDIVGRIRALGGLAIPAHIDRPSYSLLANLGLVPPGLDVPALEIFRLSDSGRLLQERPELRGWPLIRGGDAHRLSELSRAINLTIAAATMAELLLAFAGKSARSCALTRPPHTQKPDIMMNVIVSPEGL